MQGILGSCSTSLDEAEAMALTFEIKPYIDNYEGYTKTARLAFIVEKFPQLQIDALKLLVEELKFGLNTTMYTKVFSSLSPQLKSQFAYDAEWVTTTEKSMTTKMQMLESELLSAKSTMIKEDIRRAHNDLGYAHYQVGNLTEAQKCFLRTRDYSTMPRHHQEMCMNIISVSVDLTHYYQVTNFINKLTEHGGDDAIQGKMKAASGLVALHDAHFKQAARFFLDISPELGNDFHGTISAEDIGVYGALCAVATFDRRDLKALLVDNKQFLGTYLALNPMAKNLVLQYYNGEYGSALALMPAIRKRLLVDMHMSSHAEWLVRLISDRILLQYFAPYCRIDLRLMAEHTQLNEKELEKCLVALISSGKLPARIDASSRTMFRTSRDSRRAATERVLRLAEAHTRSLRRDMLCLSLMQQGFAVDLPGDEGTGPPSHPQQQQGWGGRRRGVRSMAPLGSSIGTGRGAGGAAGLEGEDDQEELEDMGAEEEDSWGRLRLAHMGIGGFRGLVAGDYLDDYEAVGASGYNDAPPAQQPPHQLDQPVSSESSMSMAGTLSSTDASQQQQSMQIVHEEEMEIDRPEP